MTIINSFSGEYRFLSNFYAIGIDYDGVRYRSVEHAYQAAKTFDKQERVAIQIADNPVRAKALGRKVTLRPDWERMKLLIMEGLLRQKFSNPYLRRELLITRPAILIEGNTWNDRYWGMCDGVGLNMLGKLLMKIRDTDG